MIAFFLIHLLIRGLKIIFTPLIAIPLFGFLILLISSTPWDYKSVLFLISLGGLMQLFELKIKDFRAAYYEKKLSIHLYDFPKGLTGSDIGYYSLSFFPAILVLFLLFLTGYLFNLSFGSPLFLIFLSSILIFLYAINPFFIAPQFSVNGHSHSTDEKLMPMHKAANEGDLKTLKKLIASKPKDIHHKTNFGTYAIHFTVKANKYTATKLLLDAGAEINCTNRYEETVLMLAASNQDFKMVQLLLANNADAQLVNNNRENALFYTLSNLSVFKLLVANEASIYNINANGESLISAAAGLKTKPELFVKSTDAPKTNAKDLVVYLLEKGLSANGLSKETILPIVKAVTSANRSVVELLLAEGADPNLKNRDQQTALSAAIAKANMPLVKLLITHNADVNLPILADFYFKNLITPLEFAYESSSLFSGVIVIQNQNAIVDYLIQHGAEINPEGKYKKAHMLRAIRLLDNNSLFQHIDTLPELIIGKETLLLDTEELKWYFTNRFLQDKAYLTMPFNTLSYYFQVMLKDNLSSEESLQDCFLMLFLNNSKKAETGILECYAKYHDKKEDIQNTAKAVLKAAFNKKANNTMIADVTTNNNIQEAIDNTLEERYLNRLKNNNQDEKTTKKMITLALGLENDFEHALKNTELVQHYIDNSEQLAKGSKTPKSLSFAFANYTTKLLIKTIEQSKFEDSKLLFCSYLHNICPYTGLDEKSEDIASNGLVLSILTKDSTISELIFERLLNESFTIENTSNAILLYNLACYYSLENDKKNLLIATKFAIKHGKEASQFLNDSDFDGFMNDADFMGVLGEK